MADRAQSTKPLRVCVDARIEGTGNIQLQGDVDEGQWDEGDGSIVAR